MDKRKKEKEDCCSELKAYLADRFDKLESLLKAQNKQTEASKDESLLEMPSKQTKVSKDNSLHEFITLKDISRVKAVIQCCVPLTVTEQKHTFNKKGIATFFMCSIDYGSLDINDTLLFIGKDGDLMGIFRFCFKLKRFKEDCLNIEYLKVRNQDNHKNHFGIHLKKEKADSLITKLTKKDLDNLDYILVLKEKNIN